MKKNMKHIGEIMLAPTGSLNLQKRFVNDIRALIESARNKVARTVNSELAILYWQVGTRIRQEILKEKRAEYGAEVVSTLSANLVMEYGKGFAEKNLRRMVQFAEYFPQDEIVATLSRQLGWSHFVAIFGIRVAEYMTELMPKEILHKKLHQAIQRAREILAKQIGDKKHQSI